MEFQESSEGVGLEIKKAEEALLKIDGLLKESQEKIKKLKDPNNMESKILILQTRVYASLVEFGRAFLTQTRFNSTLTGIIEKVIAILEVLTDKVPQENDLEAIKGELADLLKHQPDLNWLQRRLKDEAETSLD